MLAHPAVLFVGAMLFLDVEQVATRNLEIYTIETHRHTHAHTHTQTHFAKHTKRSEIPNPLNEVLLVELTLPDANLFVMLHPEV